MGAFISNIQIKGAEPDAVVAAIRAIGAVPAYVTDNREAAWTGVYPERGDQDRGQLQLDLLALTRALGRPGIALMVHDSDIFTYWLAESGEPIDAYDSTPGYFEGRDDPPIGGNVDMLLRFAPAGASRVRLDNLLHKKISAEDEAAGNTGPRTGRERLRASLRAAYEQARAQHPELPPFDENPHILQMLDEQAKAAESLAVATGKPEAPTLGSFLVIEGLMDELAGHLGVPKGQADMSFRYIRQGEGSGRLKRVEAGGVTTIALPPARAGRP
jgi:hypothetical protein